MKVYGNFNCAECGKHIGYADVFFGEVHLNFHEECMQKICAQTYLEDGGDPNELPEDMKFVIKIVEDDYRKFLIDGGDPNEVPENFKYVIEVKDE